MKNPLLNGFLIGIGVLIALNYCEQLYRRGHLQGYIAAQKKYKTSCVVDFPIAKKEPENHDIQPATSE